MRRARSLGTTLQPTCTVAAAERGDRKRWGAQNMATCSNAGICRKIVFVHPARCDHRRSARPARRWLPLADGRGPRHLARGFDAPARDWACVRARRSAARALALFRRGARLHARGRADGRRAASVGRSRRGASGAGSAELLPLPVALLGLGVYGRLLPVRLLPRAIARRRARGARLLARCRGRRRAGRAAASRPRPPRWARPGTGVH